MANDWARMATRCPAGARRTARPSENARTIRRRGPAVQSGRRVRTFSSSPRTRSAWECRARSTPRTARASRAAPAPATWTTPMSAPRRLLGRGWEHEQIQGKEHQDRDQVDQALDDDGGESGREGDRVAPRDQPGTENLLGPGHDESGREPHEGRREEVDEADPAERSQEEPQTPRAQGVDGHRDRARGRSGGRGEAPSRADSSSSQSTFQKTSASRTAARATPRRSRPRCPFTAPPPSSQILFLQILDSGCGLYYNAGPRVKQRWPGTCCATFRTRDGPDPFFRSGGRRPPAR